MSDYAPMIGDIVTPITNTSGVGQLYRVGAFYFTGKIELETLDGKYSHSAMARDYKLVER